MSRTVLHGGRVFDGTGSPVADGDVAFEDGRIVEVGTGLDGDDGVDKAGLAARALDGSGEEASAATDVQLEALVALLTDALQRV
jgi:cytosine/adenosine deaminase-related metal-dependent hydrolase